MLILRNLTPINDFLRRFDALDPKKSIWRRIQRKRRRIVFLGWFMLERVDGWDVINKDKYYSNRYFINYISIQEQNGYF